MAHSGHADAALLDATSALALVAAAALAVAYAVAARARSREPRGWSAWRTASFLAGCAVLGLVLLPGLSPYPAGDFRWHMAQHLLIGMVAPLLLVLGAPMTLLLRTLPRRHGRLVGRALRSWPVRLVANPLSALALNVGGLAVLYFTPFYGVVEAHESVHALVHLHFVAAGYLFAWVIAGPDPAPHRPSVPVRLVVLGAAVAFHALISQLLYAGIGVQVPVGEAERRGAGELMYYGGDIAELLIALALVTSWRPRARARAVAAAQA
ncbi:cytochrome c oxidase assembly protein [Motilibacter sp. E257]|uniref:Cytochrome c oxidase assembly protein n=1 Tax=Motilibacter deserti TaxID=2714956 RepID=A0ABX0GWY1_9ACTN|nr:cytochrome c oxidase assembly protein [Motilibacter deserti]NHC15085.1 cytochrome c oxidase assembly protein [Motilibacter deserti]